MNSEEWGKLRHNWKDLCEVYSSDIIGILYQNNVISYQEMDKIKAAETNQDRQEKLLFILKYKKGKQPYNKLLDALTEKKYVSLVTKIKETEANCDPNLQASDDPNEKKEHVLNILRQHFCEKTGSSILLQEVRDVLNRQKAFPDGNELKNEELASLLEIEFVQVKVVAVEKSVKGKKQKLRTVENLQLINSGMTETPKKDCEKAKETSSPSKKECQSKLLDHPRKFDEKVHPTMKYKLGFCFSDMLMETRDSKLSPLKNFHLISDLESNLASEQIGIECVKFASACMNERRNGTIYFGVAPSSSSTFIAGEIVGVSLIKEEVQEVINNYLNSSYLDSQKSVVKKVVREPKFVPIIKTEPLTLTELYVIEIDIVPSQAIMGKEIIKTKLHLLPQFNCPTRAEKGVFKFTDNGIPKLLTEDERDRFEKELESINAQRKEEEGKTKKEFKPNLRDKLLGLLTGGRNSLVDDIYPFLITSEIDSHMDQDFLLNNMSFIKHLQPEVVFDFDPKGHNNGIYKNLDSMQEVSMRVLTTDDFDKQKTTTESYDDLVNSISSKSVSHWVFCNGYEGMDPMTRREWNKCRRAAFIEALRIYIDKVGLERILIIFCLFSKSYETLLVACDEILTLLPDNWILLAESEDIVKSWQERMLSEDKLDSSDLKDRCVIGLTWEQVNNIIYLATSTNEDFKVILPCSNGSLEIVPKKRLNEWSDIDVLSAGDMDFASEDERSNKRNEIEQQFYRGEEVQWLNFWFGEQVLKREIHESLKDIVAQALDGNTPDEDKVTYAELIHQPGAGGTTSAKNILWQFRTKYRCCHVKSITEHTCDQLDEIWQYKDPTPKPLLVFIDNLDEEECIKLKGKLEERGRSNWRKSEESFDVYCTILECKRRASKPLLLKSHQKILCHKLADKEKDWFDRKNESLNKLYERDKKKVNPKLLLAFNIMRENFKPDYIKNVVKEFSLPVKDDNEIELLKIVSFFNVYDPLFQPVKVSWLDHIFKNKKSTSVSQANFFTRDVKWEAKLSEGVKFFLNLSNDRTLRKKSIQSVRILNKRVAEEILKCMKEKTKTKDSDIMLQLCKPDLYRQSGKDAGKYRSLINSVAKKRELGEDGKKYKFSQFVLHVQEYEGVEVVFHVLEALFDENKDAFTAQVISRLYLENKNWQKASMFADRAVKTKPGNSFLWDTAGRVIKAQLSDIIEKNKQNRAEGFQDANIQEIIDLADEGIGAFRREQSVSEQEMTTMELNNVAGYFGELRTIILLLNALKSHTAFNNNENLQKYLTDAKHNPAELQFLHKHAAFLKSLKGRSHEVLRRLDEEYLQMKSSHNQEDWATMHGDFSRESLINLKANLDIYFEQEKEITHSQFSKSEECLYRLERARKLGADSLNHLLLLRATRDNKTIQDCYTYILPNVRSRYCSFDDLRAILDAVTVILVDNGPPPDLQYQEVVAWSKKLYYMEQPKEIIHSYMEPYLYFVLYNFPTEERSPYICPPIELKNAIDTWYDMFKKNHPNHGQENFSYRRRVTTLFFLGNGSPLNDIVFQDNLEDLKTVSFKEKWNHPNLRKKLRLMDGILSKDGEKVNISYTTHEGNRALLPISTSHQVAKSTMWNKKVYFYLGFSFNGPKAFGMSLEKLGEGDDIKLQQSTINKRHSNQKRQRKLLLDDLWKQKFQIERKLLMLKSDPRNRRDEIRELEFEYQKVIRDIYSLLGEF